MAGIASQLTGVGYVYSIPLLRKKTAGQNLPWPLQAKTHRTIEALNMITNLMLRCIRGI